MREDIEKLMNTVLLGNPERPVVRGVVPEIVILHAGDYEYLIDELRSHLFWAKKTYKVQNVGNTESPLNAAVVLVAMTPAMVMWLRVGGGRGSNMLRNSTGRIIPIRIAKTSSGLWLDRLQALPRTGPAIADLPDQNARDWAFVGISKELRGLL